MAEERPYQNINLVFNATGATDEFNMYKSTIMSSNIICYDIECTLETTPIGNVECEETVSNMHFISHMSAILHTNNIGMNNARLQEDAEQFTYRSINGSYEMRKKVVNKFLRGVIRKQSDIQRTCKDIWDNTTDPVYANECTNTEYCGWCRKSLCHEDHVEGIDEDIHRNVVGNILVYNKLHSKWLYWVRSQCYKDAIGACIKQHMYVVGHNARRYYIHLILSEMSSITQDEDIKLTTVQSRQSIKWLRLSETITFIDSINYIPTV